MCVIVEDFITVGWCKCGCDFENVLLWYHDTHTEIYMGLNISERQKKVVKYFATRSGISYRFNSLRSLNISSNFVFLANCGHYVKFNSKYGFSRSENIEKLLLHLILVVKLADIWNFHVPVAAILDCSRSDHQGYTPTCLRWFFVSFYPYKTPYQISITCHQVHDSTFIWHIPPLLTGMIMKEFYSPGMFCNIRLTQISNGLVSIARTHIKLIIPKTDFKDHMGTAPRENERKFDLNLFVAHIIATCDTLGIRICVKSYWFV